MKSAGIRTNLAVSCVLAFTVALAPLGRANEVVRVNPDGSVTRTYTNGPAPGTNTSGTNLAPLASAAQLQAPPPGSTASVIPKGTTVVPNGALVAGSSCVAGYPSYPGYCPPAPGYYGTYTAPAPGYSMPIGRPTGSLSQPWITSVGGTTTFGYYGVPACPPAYPVCPPAYPPAGYTIPAPAYGYPCPPTLYPAQPYPVYPGAYSYSTTTSQGRFSYRNGGLSVTFGGSRGQSHRGTYTRGFSNHHRRRR